MRTHTRISHSISGSKATNLSVALFVCAHETQMCPPDCLPSVADPPLHTVRCYTHLPICSNIPITMGRYRSLDFDETAFCRRSSPVGTTKCCILYRLKCEKLDTPLHMRNYKREILFAKPKHCQTMFGCVCVCASLSLSHASVCVCLCECEWN